MKVQHIREVRAFNRYYTRVIGLLDNHYLQSKYSLPEVRVLFELYHHPDTTPSDIITELGMDKGYLSRTLQAFVKNKIARKSVSSTDKRSVSLQLTTKGIKEFEGLNTAAEKQLAELFVHLTGKECEKLTSNMKEIQQLLSGKK